MAGARSRLGARRLRLQNRVEPFQCAGQILAGDRRQTCGGQIAQQFELHRVIEIAAIRRIHALDARRAGRRGAVRRMPRSAKR